MNESAEFLAQLSPHFAPLLAKYNFVNVDTSCEHGGRECVAFYESPAQRMILELSDGGFYVLLGTSETAFPAPNIVIEHDGKSGWYALFLLVEFISGTKVITEEYLQKLWRDEVDQVQFKADLLAQWADTILPMFVDAQNAPWRQDFAAYQRSGQPNTKRKKWWGKL